MQNQRNCVIINNGRDSSTNHTMHRGIKPVITGCESNKDDSKSFLISMILLYIKLNTQRYRSGHNGADSKSVCAKAHEGSNPSLCARKRLRIGYNYESFSTKSAFVGINPLSWMKSLCDEIPLKRG